MLTVNEAKTLAKSIYLQSASMSGLDVSEQSPTVLSNLVGESYSRITRARRPEAVANMLKIIAATLEEAQKEGQKRLGEDSVGKGQQNVCPVYPFD